MRKFEALESIQAQAKVSAERSRKAKARAAARKAAKEAEEAAAAAAAAAEKEGGGGGEEEEAAEERAREAARRAAEAAAEAEAALERKEEEGVPELTQAQLEEVFKQTSLQPVALMQTGFVFESGNERTDAQQMEKFLQKNEDWFVDVDAEYSEDMDEHAFATLLEDELWWDLEYSAKPRKKRKRRRRKKPKVPKAPKAPRVRKPRVKKPRKPRVKKPRKPKVKKPRKPKLKKPRKPRVKKPRMKKPKVRSTFLRCELLDSQGRKFVFKKRERPVDARAQTYTRIPVYPQFKSWAKRVRPMGQAYSSLPPKMMNASHLVGLSEPGLAPGTVRVENLISAGPAWCSLPPQRGYEGILLDPPLRRDSDPEVPGTLSLSQFAAMKPSEEIFPRGLLFVWTDKTTLPGVIEVAHSWGLTYVENLVWILMNRAHKVHADTGAVYPVLNRSKLTLLVFRKGKSGSLELRHQRNADVLLDFVRDRELSEKPPHVFETIRTLLPHSKLLHLWAHPKVLRHPVATWDSIVDAHRAPGWSMGPVSGGVGASGGAAGVVDSGVVVDTGDTGGVAEPLVESVADDVGSAVDTTVTGSVTTTTTATTTATTAAPMDVVVAEEDSYSSSSSYTYSYSSSSYSYYSTDSASAASDSASSSIVGLGSGSGAGYNNDLASMDFTSPINPSTSTLVDPTLSFSTTTSTVFEPLSTSGAAPRRRKSTKSKRRKRSHPTTNM